jgi:hypothetical protein
MQIDFFKASCQKATSATSFGICDDTDESPAYIDHENSNNWIAIVINDQEKDITFTSIDKCIDMPKDHLGNEPKKCDAMLQSDNCLYLVELKHKRTAWQSDGVEQLENTILAMIGAMGQHFYQYRSRKAFVANRKHPNFHVIENESMERFWYKYKVRLDIQATIVIQ